MLTIFKLNRSHLPNSLPEIVYRDPSGSFTKSISSRLSNAASDVLWMSSKRSKRLQFSFNYIFGNNAKSQRGRGVSGEYGGYGTITILFFITKMCHFEGRVSRLVVIVQQSIAFAPKFRSFLRHIFSQSPQNGVVEVRNTAAVATTNSR